MWMPVPGTITPEPDPVEAVSEAAFPRSSTTEMCVVPGAPASLEDARFAPLDPVQRRPDVLVREEFAREPAPVEVPDEAPPSAPATARA